MVFLISGFLILLFEDSLKGVAVGESLPFNFISPLFRKYSTE